MSFTDILFEKSEGIATITLNRPESLNAFHPQMMADLEDAFDEIGQDSEVRAAILTGAGRAFCSGGNVKTMAQAAGGGAGSTGRQRLRHVHGAVLSIRRCNKPIIAAINGLAVGGGLDLALWCDFRIASDKARMREVYTKIGLAPGGGGVYLLPRIVGLQKALELILAADWIDAQEAERIGLVLKTVPHDELMSTARDLAGRIASSAPVSVPLAKRAVYRALNQEPDEHLEYMAMILEKLRQTEDHKEGLAAIAEKRQPRFQGK
ncbi:MAG: enoyl-CoA hydratase/isomerase family protein [Chloroflexi bacterium]|nr:enoyl-CoA hydratase/isomerase family protein [Chloroflexota bacterium]